MGRTIKTTTDPTLACAENLTRVFSLLPRRSRTQDNTDGIIPCPVALPRPPLNNVSAFQTLISK